MMNALGYDATTIGNHELDWGPPGAGGDPASGDGRRPDGADRLEQHELLGTSIRATTACRRWPPQASSKPKLVKTVGTLKVGIFGLLGSEAASVTPQAAPLTFEPIADGRDADGRRPAQQRQGRPGDRAVALGDLQQRHGRGRRARAGGARHRRHHQRPHPRRADGAQADRQHLDRHRRQVRREPGQPAADRHEGRQARRSGDGRAGRAYVLQPMDDTVPGDPHHPERRRHLHRGASTPPCRGRASPTRRRSPKPTSTSRCRRSRRRRSATWSPTRT